MKGIRLYSLFMIIFMTLLTENLSQNVNKCTNLRYPTDYNEAQCVTTRTWYIYAASVPCDNCCIRRMIKSDQPGIIYMSDFIRRDSDKSSWFNNVTIRRIQNSTSYNIDNVGTFSVLAGSNCKDTVILYSKWDDKLIVFTNKPNMGPTYLESLDKENSCKKKLYNYSPETACKAI